MDKDKNVAILGASTNPERYSNKAQKLLIEKGYYVFPINPNYEEIDNHKCYLSLDDIDFVSSLGIDDSKKITDEKILIIGEQLKDRVKYSLLTLHNEKFNDLEVESFVIRLHYR